MSDASKFKDSEGTLVNVKDAQARADIATINASLTNNVNLKKWTLKTNSAMVVNDQLDISDAGKNILIGTNLSSPTSLGRGRVVIPNIDGASYYVASSNGTAIHFRIEISNNKLTLLAITTGYKIEAVYI